jgi:proline iminopeptidase
MYPIVEPYSKGFLDVSALHKIYYEESGNPAGIPIIYINGGPGGSFSAKKRELFSPEKWRLIMYDQRGCGQSLPLAEERENTTELLVEDIEKLRRHLKIEKWVIFAGSWGSTLGLLYAEAYPASVSYLQLRGIFLAEQSGTDWLYKFGANQFFPDQWLKFLEPLAPSEYANPIDSYHNLFKASSREEKLELARKWIAWEECLSVVDWQEDQEAQEDTDGNEVAGSEADNNEAANSEVINNETAGAQSTRQQEDLEIAEAAINLHYTANDFFLRSGEILEKVDRLRQIPGVIIQGRYDMICPLVSAWELKQHWPEAEFVIVPGSGHYHGEPAIKAELNRRLEKLQKADLI